MINVRMGVWETNSSSVHSLIMTDEDTYKKLERGDLLIGGYNSGFRNKFVIYGQAYQTLKELFKKHPDLYAEYSITNLDDCDRADIEKIMGQEDIAYTLETYGGEYYEKFEDSYTTPTGEKVVAFGYFGHD